VTAPSSPEASASSWSLAYEIESVRNEAIQKHDRVARTLLKSPEVRAVVVGMAHGVTWPEHKAGGRVLIRVEHGSIELRRSGRAAQFSAGMLVALDPGEVHDVVAVEDAAFLLLVSG
jgi:quercetin dioxygenase-like cupin family protein